MDGEKTLSLLHRFELPHAPFSYSRRLMGKFRTIVGILSGVVNTLRNQLPMGHAIAAQLIRHNLSWLALMPLHQPLKEALGRLGISAWLEKNINYFAILIDSSPEILLLPLNLYKHFIDKEGITISLVVSFQPAGILSPKLTTPATNGFVANDDISLCKQVFNISATEIESVVEPYGILNDFRRETVVFVDVIP